MEGDERDLYVVSWKICQGGVCCTNFATVTISYIDDSNVKGFMHSNSLCVHDIARNFPCTLISLAKQLDPKEHCFPFQRGIGGLRR